MLFLFYFSKFTLYHEQIQMKISDINKTITLYYVPVSDVLIFYDKSWKSTVRTCCVLEIEWVDTNQN
jgi:hypothetical protein